LFGRNPFSLWSSQSVWPLPPRGSHEVMPNLASSRHNQGVQIRDALQIPIP